MGWKSTITITREQALKAILYRLSSCSDNELSDAMESLGFGDNFDLPYFGHNFLIGDPEEDDEYI